MSKKIIMMRKGLIAIKWLFILTIHFGYSQDKLSGIYSPLMFGQEHYKTYEFKNGLFEYHYGASLGDDEYGKGHYFIKNDSLILNYDLTDLKYESYFKVKKYYNDKDSLTIKLNIYNFQKEPLCNIMVYSFPNYQSTESDKNGVGHLTLKKGSNKDKIKLYVDGSFWARQIIYLESDTNYELEVFMNKSVIEGFAHPRAIKNILFKYKIIEITKNSLRLSKDGKEFKLIRK